MPDETAAAKQKTTLKTLETRITTQAEDQARRDFGQLENLLVNFTKEHPTPYDGQHGFTYTIGSYGRQDFSPPGGFYSQQNGRNGWTEFRKTWIQYRTQKLAEERTTEILTKLDLIP